MSCVLVYDPLYLDHDTGDHPERPERVAETMRLLRTSAVWPLLAREEPVFDAEEHVLRVHTAEYMRRVAEMAQAGGGWLSADPTVVSPASYRVALAAAGGAVKAVEAVLEARASTAFALVRPPGHHAMRGRGMGFCLFNNVAAAAQYVLEHWALDRVMIVDFDTHHGNGTQEVFWEDPRVLYISTHQYPCYPGSGRVEEVGAAKGAGYTVNVPLPPRSGDAAFELVCRRVLAPLVSRFQPQLIIASAGYDAHWKDATPHSGLSGVWMNMTVSGFRRLVETVRAQAEAVCSGRLVCVLEGGYTPEAVSHSVLATLEAMCGVPATDDPLGPPPAPAQEPDVTPLVERVRAIHGLSGDTRGP